MKKDAVRRIGHNGISQRVDAVLVRRTQGYRLGDVFVTGSLYCRK